MALAIPLDRSTFLADLDATSRREYAKWYRLERGGKAIAAEAAWNLYRKNESEPICAILDAAGALGVEVVRDCTLPQFAALAGRRRVSVLVAHWPLGFIRLSDIPDPVAFIASVGGSADPIVVALRNALSAAGRALLDSARPAAEAIGGLVEEINAQLHCVDLCDGIAEKHWQLQFAELVHHNRQLLDDALAEVLAPAFGLELSDGIHPAESVRDAMPVGYAGRLELIVCHSALLGEAIKRARPRCLIMTNKGPTRPLLRLIVFKQVIDLLANQPDDDDLDYFETVIAVRLNQSSRGP